MKLLLPAAVLLAASSAAALADPLNATEIARMNAFSTMQTLDLAGDPIRRAEKGQIVAPGSDVTAGRTSIETRLKWWRDYMNGLVPQAGP